MTQFILHPHIIKINYAFMLLLFMTQFILHPPSLFNFATYPSPKLAIPWIYLRRSYDVPTTFLRRSYDVPTTFLRRSYDVPTTFGQFLAKLSVTNPKLST